jgi:hypothetical protein
MGGIGSGIPQYTEERADIIIETLEAGYRAYTAAQRVGVTRMTIFNWRKAYPEFGKRWEQAVASATDRLEEVVYRLALEGDLGACMWWLKNHRAETYDRPTLIKLGLMRAALQRGNVTIDADGIPILNRQSAVRIYMPDNGRGDRAINRPIEHRQEAQRQEAQPQEPTAHQLELQLEVQTQESESLIAQPIEAQEPTAAVVPIRPTPVPSFIQERLTTLHPTVSDSRFDRWKALSE